MGLKERLRNLAIFEDPDAQRRKELTRARLEATTRVREWLGNPNQQNLHRVGVVEEGGVRVTFTRNGIEKVELI